MTLNKSACLSVVMPAYNEAAYIDTIITQVLAQPEVMQLIVVDDGSTDKTQEKILAWKARDARVEVVIHPVNRGKGAAIRSGLGQVKGAAVVIQDADLEYNPQDYTALLSPLLKGEADAVYGNRFFEGSSFNGFFHRFGNKTLTMVARVLTGWPLQDEATCYKMLRTEILNKIELREEGFGFCPEITVKLSRMGARFVELPIRYNSRTTEEGKKIRLWHGVEALWCLVKYRFQPKSWFLKK
jgi:dolichol-phosphate mannosyltransferase